MKSPNAMLEADEFGWIPLHYAAHFGHVEVVKLFLKENISLAYIGDRERMTTLHISAKEGHHVYLINEQDKDGNTPFHLAAMKGHCELLIMLAYKYNRRIAWMALNKDGLSTVGIIQSVNKRLMSKEKAKVGERPYGDWLRAGFRRIEKPKGKKHGSQIGDWEETSDQTREPPQTPRNHGEGSSNDTFANMVTITERDKSLALFTGVEVVDIFVSMENALEDYVMQTDIPKKRQQLDILGENLISMPNMFMEKDGRENIGVSSDETLAAKTNVLSCGSSRDNKNNSSTRTRKWKKKEKHEKTKSAPIHDNKGFAGKKVVGQKKTTSY
nr:isoform 4 of ankyrin-2 [Quercus suber]